VKVIALWHVTSYSLAERELPRGRCSFKTAGICDVVKEVITVRQIVNNTIRII
jgi:hypothetical protein